MCAVLSIIFYWFRVVPFSRLCSILIIIIIMRQCSAQKSYCYLLVYFKTRQLMTSFILEVENFSLFFFFFFFCTVADVTHIFNWCGVIGESFIFSFLFDGSRWSGGASEVACDIARIIAVDPSRSCCCHCQRRREIEWYQQQQQEEEEEEEGESLRAIE